MSSARPLIHSGRRRLNLSENKWRLRTSLRVQPHVLDWRRAGHLRLTVICSFIRSRPPPLSSFYHQRHAAPLGTSFFQLPFQVKPRPVSDSDTWQASAATSAPLRLLCPPPQLMTISLLFAPLCCSFASFHPFLSLGSAPAGPVPRSLMMLRSQSSFLCVGVL